MGFFGELPISFPDGSSGVATEFSVGVNFDGTETEIPTIVPTLDPNELQLLTSDIIPNKGEIPESIMRKAIDHAKLRISQGLSPFKEEVAQEPNFVSANPFVQDPNSIFGQQPQQPQQQQGLDGSTLMRLLQMLFGIK